MANLKNEKTTSADISQKASMYVGTVLWAFIYGSLPLLLNEETQWIQLLDLGEKQKGREDGLIENVGGPSTLSPNSRPYQSKKWKLTNHVSECQEEKKKRKERERKGKREQELQYCYG